MQREAFLGLDREDRFVGRLVEQQMDEAEEFFRFLRQVGEGRTQEQVDRGVSGGNPAFGPAIGVGLDDLHFVRDTELYGVLLNIRDLARVLLDESCGGCAAADRLKTHDPGSREDVEEHAAGYGVAEDAEQRFADHLGSRPHPFVDDNRQLAAAKASGDDPDLGFFEHEGATPCWAGEFMASEFTIGAGVGQGKMWKQYKGGIPRTPLFDPVFSRSRTLAIHEVAIECRLQLGFQDGNMPNCCVLVVVVALAGSMKATPAIVQAPGIPIAPHPRPKLDTHLAAWEKAIGSATSIRLDFTLRRHAAGGLLEGESKYSGSLLAMRPNHIRFRIDNDAACRDFELYIHNGKSLFAYNGLQKTVTELKQDHWFYERFRQLALLELLCAKTAKELRSRYDVRLMKEDADYLYLELRPLSGKMVGDFKRLRVALYQPRHRQFAYLPAQLFMIHANDETEQWKFSNSVTNIPEMSEKSFQFEEIPGFRFQKASELWLTPEVKPDQP